MWDCGRHFLGKHIPKIRSEKAYSWHWRQGKRSGHQYIYKHISLPLKMKVKEQSQHILFNSMDIYETSENTPPTNLSFIQFVRDQYTSLLDDKYSRKISKQRISLLDTKLLSLCQWMTWNLCCNYDKWRSEAPYMGLISTLCFHSRRDSRDHLSLQFYQLQFACIILTLTFST